jgi:SAM-dependent methyltransferase
MIANEPWGSAADRRTSPSAARNRDPILDVLRRVLPASGLVLEIASGTGEHAVHFAANLPGVEWQPSDPDADSRRSIAAWRAGAGLRNLREPLALDAAAADWPVERADGIVCINMLHISPWEATVGLMTGAGRRLPPGGPLVIYGPFRQPGVATAPSNEAFDDSLRARNAAWGLRDTAEVAALAAAHGLDLVEIVAMPANNLTLVIQRR